MRELIDRMGYVPRNCVWEITRACDLRCAHCGTGAGHPREGELSLDECCGLVSQLAALGTELITLSGGEPTMRSDWHRIARCAVDSGIAVNMVTNGQSADPEALAREVVDAGLSNLGISLDGLEATHDGIRRRGAFARATRTIDTLASAGLWVDVMVTVNRRNLAELPAVYSLAQSLGARGFRVQLGKPMGNQTCREDLTLEPRHLLTLMPALAKLVTAGELSFAVGDSVGYYGPYEKLLRKRGNVARPWTGCYAGCQAIGIQADGGVKGCLSLQPREGEADRFLEGNVQEHSLEEIWHRPGGFAYNRQFSLDDLTGPCRSCDFAELCRGGAKCAAYAFTGELGSDPMCYYRVALEQAQERRRAWTGVAAAAAMSMALSLGVAGCSEHTGPEVDCSEADCECMVCPEYGVGLPCEPCDPVDLYRSCCCDDVQCTNPCPECDYGIWPPADPQWQTCCED